MHAYFIQLSKLNISKDHEEIRVECAELCIVASPNN